MRSFGFDDCLKILMCHFLLLLPQRSRVWLESSVPQTHIKHIKVECHYIREHVISSQGLMRYTMSTLSFNRQICLLRHWPWPTNTFSQDNWCYTHLWIFLRGSVKHYVRPNKLDRSRYRPIRRPRPEWPNISNNPSCLEGRSYLISPPIHILTLIVPNISSLVLYI